MRALILNGSVRPIGNCGNLIGDILEEFEKEGIEAIQVPLYDYHFTPCNHCLTCEVRGDGMCMDTDDGTNEILDVMREADVILFVCPGYAGGIPGVMKLFMEKASFILEKSKQGLHGKYGAAITVSEHDGAESAYMQLVYWMLRAEMLVVGAHPLPVFRARVSPEYLDDKEAMKGVKNLIAHLTELSEKN